ncbi:hypothetical protein IWW50_002897, partial [Coemansia erecta]
PPKPFNPSQIVVGSSLQSDARSTVLYALHEHAQKIEPESAEFYSLCERVLRILIQKYPRSTVPELAMAVNRAVDEALCASPAPVLSPVAVSPRADAAAVKGKEPSSNSGDTMFGGGAHSQFPFGVPSSHKFARQGSGYLGHGRPVSVIMEESDSEA